MKPKTLPVGRATKRGGRRPCTAAVALVALLCLSTPAAHAAARQKLPQLAGAPLPPQIATVVGWEQARAALAVDKTGKVTAVRLMEATPGFEAPVKAALSAWTFRPALGPKGPIPSHVLVVLVYRPPVLYNTPTLGDRPRHLAPWPASVPFPVSAVTPMYPPQTVGDALVLVTLHVSSTGTTTDAHVVGPPSGFDQTSLAAARAWRFRPAKMDGAPAPALACVVFGFREPVTRGPVR